MTVLPELLILNFGSSFSGLGSGFNDDEGYNVYSEPWRKQNNLASNIYRCDLKIFSPKSGAGKSHKVTFPDQARTWTKTITGRTMRKSCARQTDSSPTRSSPGQTDPLVPLAQVQYSSRGTKKIPSVWTNFWTLPNVPEEPKFSQQAAFHAVHFVATVLSKSILLARSIFPELLCLVDLSSTNCIIDKFL